MALCEMPHPTIEVVVCQRNFDHDGDHMARHRGHTHVWQISQLGLFARSSDPESSHRAASRGFDVQKGLGGFAREIFAAASSNWMTCRELIDAIFGSGPYTYEEAVSINKVQTYALKLHREGHLERRDPDGEPIQYRRPQ